MKKYIFLFTALIMSIVLVACGNDNTTNGGETVSGSDQAEDYEAVIVAPSTADVKDEITFDVKVKKDGKAVEEIDDVTFTITESNENIEETIKGKEKEKGQYEAQYVIDHEGVFYVKADVQIGDVALTAETNFVVGETDGALMFEPAIPEEGVRLQPTLLATDLKTKEGELVEGKKVYFEIYQDELVVEREVMAKEEAPGRYVAPYEFKNKGDYKIIMSMREVNEPVQEEAHIHIIEEAKEETK